MLNAIEFEQNNAVVFERFEKSLELKDDATLNHVLHFVIKMASIALNGCTGTHLPRLDGLMVKTADIVRDQLQATSPHPGKSIILASELYPYGGHSRIVEDIVASAPGEVIVLLTDYNDNYARGNLELGAMYKHFRTASVLTIPKGSHISKVFSVTKFINMVCPDKLYLLLHHADAIGYVAASAHTVLGLKSFFIHHADQNPTLGATINNHDHLDICIEHSLKCKKFTSNNCRVLPLYVKDRGSRNANFSRGLLNVASAGNPGKFCFTGPLNYPARILSSLKNPAIDKYYHFGKLRKIQLKNIEAHLLDNGLSPDRFRHMSWVESIWKAFLEVDVHVLIGTAPVGGGKTAIEAQGAGVPVLWYYDEISKDFKSSLNRITSIYESSELSWSNLENLDSAISKVTENYSKYSLNSRKFYEKHFNKEQFKKSLDLEV